MRLADQGGPGWKFLVKTKAPVLQECCEPEVRMRGIQGCLDHPAQQDLTGGTAIDVVGRGTVLGQYPGHLRLEILGLALLEFLLDGLHHPLG